MPPQANASVTIVTGAGVADDWDRAGTTGAEKWNGAADAYYREKTDRVSDGAGTVNIFTRRTLWVDTADADLMNVDTDDRITFALDDGSGPFTATAVSVARARLAGIPTNLQTTRIELEPA